MHPLVVTLGFVLFCFVSRARVGNAFGSVSTKLQRKHSVSWLSWPRQHFQPLCSVNNALVGFRIVSDSLEPIILKFGLFPPKLITLHLLLLNEAHMLIRHFHAHLPRLAGVLLSAVLVTSAFPYPLELAVT